MEFNPTTCPSPEDWDAYLLAADEDRDKVHLGHLASCHFCQVTLQWRMELLGAVAEAMEQVDHGVITSFVPYDETDTSAEGRLAAQSHDLAKDHNNSVSLVSADQRVLLKVVRDETTKETWLYVIADEAELYRNVVVRPFGDDREFITDEFGKARLGLADLAPHSLTRAEIRIPRAVFVLEPFLGRLAGDQSTVLRSESGDEIRVSLHRVGSDQEIEIELLRLSPRIATGPLRLAIREEDTGRMRWLTVDAKPAKIGGLGTPQVLHIYLIE
jgi:hypothetical protein